MKGRQIKYTAEELAWIKGNCKMPRAEAHAMFCEKFSRDDVNVTNFKALCNRNGWKTGRTGFFPVNHNAWNKGKPHNCAGSRVSHFKAGHVPANCKPMWSERGTSDGYIEMKVPLENPHTGHSTRFMLKHKYLWERANGPVPKGYALKALDGDRRNTDPTNWVALPRAFIPRLSGRFGRGYDAAPDELKPVILAVTRLEFEATKGEAQ